MDVIAVSDMVYYKAITLETTYLRACLLLHQWLIEKSIVTLCVTVQVRWCKLIYFALHTQMPL